MIPSCKDFALSVSTGEYHEAGLGRRILLRLHYMACYICRRYAAQIRFLGEAARAARAGCSGEKVSALQARLIDRLAKS